MTKFLSLKNLKILEKTKNFIIGLLFPEFCSGCDKEGNVLCESCLQKLRQEFQYPKCFYCGARSPVDKKTVAGRTCVNCRRKTLIYAFFSPFSYSNRTIKNLIHKLKYNRNQKISKILGEELSFYFSKIACKIPENSVIVPIPMHKDKFMERGFNQSELLANCLSKNLGSINYRPVLKKIKLTPDQTELNGAERRKNIKGSFIVVEGENIKNKDVLIVDDVKTTGSTIEEAARTLRKSGAKKILAITVAN